MLTQLSSNCRCRNSRLTDWRRYCCLSAPAILARVWLVATDQDNSMAIHKVSAPLAGIFYRRPSPEEAPFKSEGDRISVGDTVGVIEAMKSFFPLEAETGGRLIRFLV